MKVIIRTDASIQIGTGHVMRCLTLAGELRARGATVTFICREFPGHLCDLITSNGFEVIRLPLPHPSAGMEELGMKRGNSRQEPAPEDLQSDTRPDVAWVADAEETIAALKKNTVSCDWLVVDHYALDTRWESCVRKFAQRIMVIDDLADRPHDCDLLLDQNLFEDMETRYKSLVPSDCRQLLGPCYALLRQEFREARKNLHFPSGNVGRILVFFGGSDPQNMTALALDAISQLNRPDITVDVVIGASNPHRENIEFICEAMPNTNLHVQLSNMAELMTDDVIAIGAGGVSAWERCCTGIPSLVVAVASNQEAVCQKLAVDGAILYLGRRNGMTADHCLIALQAVLFMPELRASLSIRSRSLVDGEGAERVTIYMLSKN